MKLSLVQLCIIIVLFSPEDPKAWARNRIRHWQSENPKKRADTHRKWRLANPGKLADWGRKWRLKNPVKNAASARKWQLANPQKALANSRKWKLANIQKVRASVRIAHKAARTGPRRSEFLEKRRTYQRRLLGADMNCRILAYARNRVRSALKRNSKAGKTADLIGCTIPELKAHLEAQFRPGMTWENYGPVWHVDHIRPCASFDLTDPAQQRICFNVKNLQPLFAEENLRKGAKCEA